MMTNRDATHPLRTAGQQILGDEAGTAVQALGPPVVVLTESGPRTYYYTSYSIRL